MSVKNLITKANKSVLRSGPLWTGPEGQGPDGGITQSMIGRWLECRTRFAVRNIEGWKGVDSFQKAMEYGNCWHVCEEALASMKNPQLVDVSMSGQGPVGIALIEYCKGLNKKYPTQQDEVDHWYRTCKAQFPCYVDYWSKHPDVEQRTPLMQEQVFDVPYKLPSGRVVRLRGKFDSVDLIGSGPKCTCGADRSGPSAEAHSKKCPAGKPHMIKGPAGIYLQENKTKGSVDEKQIKEQLHFDLQTMMYLLCLQELTKDLGEKGTATEWALSPILGVRYNVVRRPFSGGRGSIKRREGSKNVPAETKDQFYERLTDDYFRAEPEYWFMRWKSEVSPEDVERFRKECLDPLLEAICWWYDNQVDKSATTGLRAPDFHWRHPYGVHNYVDEGYGSDVDKYVETGSTVGLVKQDSLFPELT